jgi:hypothetical protein
MYALEAFRAFQKDSDTDFDRHKLNQNHTELAVQKTPESEYTKMHKEWMKDNTQSQGMQSPTCFAQRQSTVDSLNNARHNKTQSVSLSNSTTKFPKQKKKVLTHRF